jgi:SHS2 domain-containing protein
MSWSYTFVDHTADIAVDIRGKRLSELFTASAYAWLEAITEQSTNSFETKIISLGDENLEVLLVSFISELNFFFQSDNWIMSSIQKIDIDRKDDLWNLSAVVLGGNFDRNKFKLKSEIKAVTYHQMKIKEVDGEFSTRIVFDI